MNPCCNDTDLSFRIGHPVYKLQFGEAILDEIQRVQLPLGLDVNVQLIALSMRSGFTSFSPDSSRCPLVVRGRCGAGSQ